MIGKRLWPFALVLLLVSSGFAVTRHYYIAAEDVIWDYAPSGRDLMDGRAVPQPWGSHTQWHKTRYIEYTDDTFTVRKAQPEWLGILGPVIRGEVGDEIVVDFLNRSAAPHSIHPHGLRYDKANEGSFYLPWGAGARVLHNHRFTYHWFADAGSGPAPGQLNSVVWWYHGHVDEPRETNAGLLGPIVITAKGHARPDGSPKDVDREFVTAFMIFDELAGKNEGQFHAINGLVFGNLLGLTMKQGERVRWYVMSMGNEKDVHSPHWHGKTLSDGRRSLDVVELLPAGTTTVDMVADNPGTWLYHCHVEDHMEAGMMAWFTIYPTRSECPLEFSEGKFWGDLQNYSVTIRNASRKPIRSYALRYDHLMAPGYLVAPFNNVWESSGPVDPAGTQAVTMKPYLPGVGAAILGWAVMPSRVVYADGSTWTPTQQNECFQMFWRDKDHPDLPILPPEQKEMQED